MYFWICKECIPICNLARLSFLRQFRLDDLLDDLLKPVVANLFPFTCQHFQIFFYWVNYCTLITLHLPILIISKCLIRNFNFKNFICIELRYRKICSLQLSGTFKYWKAQNLQYFESKKSGVTPLSKITAHIRYKGFLSSFSLLLFH